MRYLLLLAVFISLFRTPAFGGDDTLSNALSLTRASGETNQKLGWAAIQARLTELRTAKVSLTAEAAREIETQALKVATPASATALVLLYQVFPTLGEGRIYNPKTLTNAGDATDPDALAFVAAFIAELNTDPEVRMKRPAFPELPDTSNWRKNLSRVTSLLRRSEEVPFFLEKELKWFQLLIDNPREAMGNEVSPANAVYVSRLFSIFHITLGISIHNSTKPALQELHYIRSGAHVAECALEMESTNPILAILARDCDGAVRILPKRLDQFNASFIINGLKTPFDESSNDDGLGHLKMSSKIAEGSRFENNTDLKIDFSKFTEKPAVDNPCFSRE